MIKFEFKLGSIVRVRSNGTKGVVVKRTVSQSAEGYEYTYRVYIDGADVAQDYKEEEIYNATINAQES